MVLHRLDALQLDNALKGAGWTNDEARRIAWALAMRESSGYYDIMGGPNANGTYDYGLFQINEIHKGNPNVVWENILTAEENSKFAYYLSKNGTIFSPWALPNLDGSVTGYAAVMQKNDPATYALYYSRWKRWYDAYPELLAQASATTTVGVVAMANLKPGLRNADVQEYQAAMRRFITRSGRNPDKVNPAGATGYYGSETRALTQWVYRILAYRKVLTYPKIDTVPNKTLVRSIGLTPV